MVGLVNYSMFDGYISGQIQTTAYIVNTVNPNSVPDEVSYNLKSFIIRLQSVTFVAQPAEGDFSYQHTPPQAGDTPIEAMGSIQLRSSATNAQLLSISGLSLTFAELTSMTAPQLYHFLFDGDNSMTGNSSGNTLYGLAGKDTMSGNGGHDILRGGLANDALSGDAGNDKLYGDDGSDNVLGGIGNDSCYGGAGHDSIAGGDGIDTLKGDSGNDRIVGGFGRDLLTGGSGRDTFVYQTLSKFNAKESGITAASRDTITDFRHGQDKIDPSFILVQKFKFLGTGPLTGLGQIHYKFSGNDTLVEISTDADRGAELSILLKGHIGLSASDFIL